MKLPSHAPWNIICDRCLRSFYLVFGQMGAGVGIVCLLFGGGTLYMLMVSVVLFAGAAILLELYMRNFFFCLEEEMNLKKAEKGICL